MLSQTQDGYNKTLKAFLITISNFKKYISHQGHDTKVGQNWEEDGSVIKITSKKKKVEK